MATKLRKRQSGPLGREAKKTVRTKRARTYSLAELRDYVWPIVARYSRIDSSNLSSAFNVLARLRGSKLTASTFSLGSQMHVNIMRGPITVFSLGEAEGKEWTVDRGLARMKPWLYNGTEECCMEALRRTTYHVRAIPSGKRYRIVRV